MTRALRLRSLQRMTAYHLAQVNIGLPIEALDSERLRGFVEMLEPINALADAAPGFVWRLQTEDGDATAIRAFDDDRLIMNMSVWESVEDFAAFVYGAEHAVVMRRRRQWFVPMQVYAAAWWIPAGVVPTPADAVERLDLLRRLGPTQDAFTVQRPFPPPGQAVPVDTRDGWTCSV
jgi:heme-degrading monooxygenase HmoA